MKVFAATLLTLGPNPMAIATKTHRLGDNRHLAKSSKAKSGKIPKGNVSLRSKCLCSISTISYFI